MRKHDSDPAIVFETAVFPPAWVEWVQISCLLYGPRTTGKRLRVQSEYLQWCLNPPQVMSADSGSFYQARLRVDSPLPRRGYLAKAR